MKMKRMTIVKGVIISLITAFIIYTIHFIINAIPHKIYLIGNVGDNLTGNIEGLLVPPLPSPDNIEGNDSQIIIGFIEKKKKKRKK